LTHSKFGMRGYLWSPDQLSLVFKMDFIASFKMIKKVWRYQSSYQKPLMEGQTIQWTKWKGQTLIYKTLHRKSRTKKTGVNSDALEGLAAPAPLVTPIVLLITTWISSDMEIMLDNSLIKKILYVTTVILCIYFLNTVVL
jgi:hypothetical protein